MPIPLSPDYDASGLRAVARRSKDANQTRPLLKLAAIYDDSARTEAAVIGGVTVQIVRDWVAKMQLPANEVSRLGRADRADPLFNRGQLGGAQEAAGNMIVSGGNSPTVLEPVKEALDLVSGRIRGAVDRVLDVPILLGGDLGYAAPGTNDLAGSVAAAALVSQHDLGIGIVLGHEVGEGRAVVSLAGCQEERDWKTLSVGPGMEFGWKAITQAAKSLFLSSPLRRRHRGVLGCLCCRPCGFGR